MAQIKLAILKSKERELFENIVLSKKYSDKNGKPYLFNSGYYISISYSDTIVLYGFCKMNLGIDIELLKKRNINFAKHIFSKSEISYIFSEKRNILEKFYNVWTKKESYSKFLGTGLTKKILKDNIFDKKVHFNALVLNIDNKKYILNVCTKKYFDTLYLVIVL